MQWTAWVAGQRGCLRRKLETVERLRRPLCGTNRLGAVVVALVQGIRAVLLVDPLGRGALVFLLVGVALEVGLVVVFDYSTSGTWMLHTAPVPSSLCLLLFPLAIGMLLAEEARKWLVQRAFRKSPGRAFTAMPDQEPGRCGRSFTAS